MTRHIRLATVGSTVLVAASLLSAPALGAPATSATAEHIAHSQLASTDVGRRPTVVGAPPVTGEAAATSHTTPGTALRARALAAADTPASRAVALGAVDCPDGFGGLCGTYPVPVDRSRPAGPTTNIDFRFLAHTAAGTAVSTLWWNGGGPGPSTTRIDPWLPGYLFGDLLESYDVLLTDVRGTGSDAPACPALQSFVGYYPGTANHAPIEDCAQSIADRVSTYGSADSARDLEDIRIALGVPSLDLVGNSYGGVPAAAYAVRFPATTRSLILSSPVIAGADLRTEVRETARGINRIVDTLCRRSVGCRVGIGDARAALADGVRRLRLHPVTGVSASANHPTPQPVRLTEATLFTLLQESDATFLTVAGEAPAALVALGRGDAAPALRLAADYRDLVTLSPGDPVPPEVESGGGYYAIECSDYTLPWRSGLTPNQRLRAAQQSVLTIDGVAPWKPAQIVTSSVYADWEQLINCYRWPDLRGNKVLPPGVPLPSVPTLVMTSDFDSRVSREYATVLAGLWPDAQLLDIGGALHGAALWACGPQRVQDYLRAPGSPQQACDASEFPAFRAVGEFPTTSATARPLARDGSRPDSSTVADRRVAAVALAAALDANAVASRATDLGPGAGLRGGRFVTSATETEYRIDLDGVRFARDVATSGSLVYPFDGSPPTIDITFRADDGRTGHLHVVGHWDIGRSAAEPGVLPVHGEIQGRPVALRLPL